MKTAQDITVVVPVYNTPVAYLDECLRSLHQQTVPPRKILIMDDGSTLDEIQAYYLAQKDLQVVRTERNRGLGPTMNRALQLCQTDFLLKLDSDDLARPELVEEGALWQDREHLLLRMAHASFAGGDAALALSLES